MIHAMKERRSVRTYDGKGLKEQEKEQLMSYAKEIQNPFQIPVTFRLLDAKKDGLTCPVVTGTDLYIGGKIKNVPYANAAFGYTFELLVLYAQSLGIGTVWLGGTMNRDAYEKAMELEEDEMMPCASPLGYPAKKMSVREAMMRKAIKADERLAFETIFYKGTFEHPLSKEDAGNLTEALEMVRIAPSAANKQPWRVLVTEQGVHFYLKRSKGFGGSSSLDMQMIDIGIAMSHFELAAKEQNLAVRFVQEQPEGCKDAGMEYIGTYLFV